MKHPALGAVFAGVTLLGLTGCKMPMMELPPSPDAAGPATSASTAGKKPGLPSVFKSKPALIKTSSMEDANDGLAHLNAQVIVDENNLLKAPKFQIMALPGTWTDAVITLFSSTANQSFQTANNQVILGAGAFIGPAPIHANAAFPPLRPSNDYEARAFIRNSAGAIATNRLAGSQDRTGLTLNAGLNNIIFTININANEATYDIAAGSSAYNNFIADGNFVFNDTFTIDTGMAASQDGVDHLDIKLTGTGGTPCYPGTALIGRITNPLLFQTFSFNSANDVTIGTPGDYVAANMSAGAGLLTAGGQIDVEAYHTNDATTPFAKASFAVGVFGKPTVKISLQ